MSMKYFDVATMIAISNPWVDELKDKPVLVASPVTAGLVPFIEAAHRNLMALHVSSSEKEELLRSLTERIASLDKSYGEKLRILFALLTSLAAASSPSRRTALEEALQVLFPGGLTINQKSFLASAGHVELAVTRMTPEMETLLSDIVIEERSLLDRFNEWVAVGRELGDLERERTRIVEPEEDGTVRQRDILRARFTWIRVVKLLAGLLEVDSDIPEADRTRILQPLRTAESKVRRPRGTDEAVPEDEILEEDENPEEASEAAGFVAPMPDAVM